FFFQAEDGIRDPLVTGVQTCALPISAERAVDTPEQAARAARAVGFPVAVKALAPEMPHKERVGGIRLGLADAAAVATAASEVMRSEERRVGKGGRARGWRGRGIGKRW